MRTIVAALTLMAFTSGAFAQGRPNTVGMTCGQANSIVSQRKAVVLATGPNTYDRFVRYESLCPDYARPAFVPTRDNPNCNIGFYCSASPPMFSR
jgi:hypothetical protein